MRDPEAPAPLWHSAAAIVAILVMMLYAFVLERRVPLLGWADLGFHELGHMITRPFGETVSFIMGSGTQVLVPLGLATYFWLTRRDASAAFLLGWTATSMQDASVYIADAPYERLPLIGGDHDWAHLLSQWNMLDRADSLADLVWFGGLLAGIAALGIAAMPFLRRGYGSFKAAKRAELAASLPVREARPHRRHPD
jgi:hypothetical protein